MAESDIRQRKVRLGDLLIQAGLLSDAQLQLALQGLGLDDDARRFASERAKALGGR